MITEFAIAEVMPGRLNALVKNIMRQTGTDNPNEAVRLVNSGEWVISPARSYSWREQDGVIYFSVESDGTTGEDWITRLESKGFRVSDYAKSVLRSPDFKPTKGVTTEIAILKGMLFEDRDRITSNIHDLAMQRKLTTPKAEVACLIREKFTDKEIKAMGLIWIVTMHEPINDSGGDPLLLGADRDDDSRWLDAYYVEPDGWWNRGCGFTFVVPQGCSQG